MKADFKIAKRVVGIFFFLKTENIIDRIKC